MEFLGNSHSVDTGLNGNTGIVHVAANVSEDLSLQAELADGLAIGTGLLRGTGGGKLDLSKPCWVSLAVFFQDWTSSAYFLCRSMTHVVNTEVVKSLGDLNLLLSVKEGIGELLALTEGALNNLEAGDIAQEVGHADVVAVGIAGGGVGILASLNADETGVVACSTTVRIPSS